MTNKKTIISSITILLTVLGIAYWIIKDQVNWFDNGGGNNEIILFYGQECPHCQRLEEWIKTNKIDEKIKINRKEVYHNQSNAELLGQKAKKCAVNTNSIGVPFLTDGEKCYTGEDEIMNLIKIKTGVK